MVSTWISLITGIVLFLYGMCLMGDGLKKVAGSRIEVILYRLTGSPLRGVLFGAGVTAVIQSSSATSVMVVGFVNAGMMKTHQAISVILGSILGTSITGWILCLSDLGGSSGWLSLLSTSTLTCAAAIFGILLRMGSRKQEKKHLGDVLLGFAVLMIGMTTMSDAVTPLRENETFVRILTTFSNPILGIVSGTLFTAILQSASAAVGILQALTIAGTVRFDVALPLLMGISIGAAVPVLLSAISAGTDGKRTALTYLLSNTIGVAVIAVVFYLLNGLWHFEFMSSIMTSVSVAALNTLLRLATVLLLFPMITPLERLLQWIIPDRQAEAEPVLQLEERFLQHPSLAVEQSQKAIGCMAQMAAESLYTAMNIWRRYSEEGFAQVLEKENTIDVYEDRIGSYLQQLMRSELDTHQNKDVGKMLHTLSDIECLSDHAVSLAQTAQKRWSEKIHFSDAALHELAVLEQALREIIALTTAAFLDSDVDRAYQIEPLANVIQELCEESRLRHIARLQNGQCSLEAGMLQVDMLVDYERIAGHCSNIAVAIIALESNCFDTHEFLSQIKQGKNTGYIQAYERASEKYSL